MTIQLNDLIGPADRGTPSAVVVRRRIPTPSSVVAEIRKEADKDEQQEDDWQEKRIQRLLDPINSADEE